jgi:pimeloyl-ACP methyl ester carboxylesterase
MQLNPTRMFVALATCLVTGLAASPCAAQSAGPSPLTYYASPQLLAIVPGGRNINLVCTGQGSPTVILTAGLGGWSANWLRVQPAIAELTRVCSWDRAGFGFSDPRLEPLDIAASSKDLEDALAAAGVRGPYILVGHSMGGLETLLVADRHQSEVAGIVLVDPTFPSQYQRFARVAPRFTEEAARGRAESRAASTACAEALSALAPGRQLPPGCPPLVSQTYPRPIVAALDPLQSDPQRVLTQSSMTQQMFHSTELGLNPRRNYGDVPLIVLSAPADDSTVPPGVPMAFSFAPGTDPRILDEVPVLARELSGGHDELARLSSKGSKRVILGSGHMIQLIKPEIVISAVTGVVKQAREID